VMTKMANRSLSGLVRFYQTQVVLSTNDCKQLSADLASGNPVRLGIWKLYFHRAAEGRVKSGRPPVELQDVLGVYSEHYTAHEKPARSNYFGALLLALAQKQHSDGATVGEVVGFLGAPDETSNSLRGEVMLYRFNASGQKVVGLVEEEKGAVRAIDIQLEPPSRQIAR